MMTIAAGQVGQESFELVSPSPSSNLDQGNLGVNGFLQHTRRFRAAVSGAFSTEKLLWIFTRAIQWLYYGFFLGFTDLYRLRYRYLESDHTLPTKLEQWVQITTIMFRNWETIFKIAVFVLPVTFTLLQISHIVDNPLARMTAIMAAISSAVSSISSYLYTREKACLLDQEDLLMARWIKASQHPNHISSVDFWACLAVPLYSLLWSIAFFVATIGILVWLYQCPIDICTSISWMAGSAVPPTLLFAISAIFIFRLCKLLQYVLL